MNRNNATKKKGKRKLKSGAKVFLAFFGIAVVCGLLFLLYKTSGAKPTNGNPSSETTTTGAQSNAVSDSTTTAQPAATTKAPRAKDDIINVIQKNGDIWNLKLVNQWNRIDETFQVSLKAVPGVTSMDKTCDERMLPYLEQLVEASKKAGKNLSIKPRSLHRPYARQKYLFDHEVAKQKKPGMSQEEAERIAATVVARPGTSEHNTGLAVDFHFADINALVAECEFTDEYDWMMENAAEYGFILRFPKDKDYITGVIFEPWHFRYVGKEAATYIMDKKITLEEYIAEIEGQDCY